MGRLFEIRKTECALQNELSGQKPESLNHQLSKFIAIAVALVALSVQAAAGQLPEHKLNLTPAAKKKFSSAIMRIRKEHCDVTNVSRYGEVTQQRAIYWVYCMDGGHYQVLILPSMEQMFIDKWK